MMIDSGTLRCSGEQNVFGELALHQILSFVISVSGYKTPPLISKGIAAEMAKAWALLSGEKNLFRLLVFETE